MHGVLELLLHLPERVLACVNDVLFFCYAVLVNLNHHCPSTTTLRMLLGDVNEGAQHNITSD